MVLFQVRALFVPSILETDIYRNIADNVTLLKIQIAFLGNRRKLALKFHKLCVDPVICGSIGIFDGVVQRVTTGFAAGKIREKSVVFFASVGRKTAGYINFIGKIPFCIITRSVVICSFRSSIYQFQNEGKRVHDRMKDPGKNSSISGNVIIRKLSYIRKNDRYIRLFILVGRKIRCYTVLYRVQDCCRRKRYTVI